MVKYFVLAAVLHLNACATLAQKVKTRDIKRALEQGKVMDFQLLAGDQFTPGTNQEFDLRIQLEGGITLLASENHVIWNYAEINADNTRYKIRGEFLANGKGVMKPRDPAAYYPDVSIQMSVTLAGKKVEKLLTPLHCYQNLMVVRTGIMGESGDRGDRGSRGSSGDRGGRGSSGTRGPDFLVQVVEETIVGKTHMVLVLEDKKYPLDPDCSTVTIVSRGGSGGRGGRGGGGGSSPENSKSEYTGNGGKGGNGGEGGDGGDGGNITIMGDAYEKYKSKIVLLSQGGTGGEGGEGGDGGSGRSEGRSGSDGTSGADGRSREIIIKN